MLRNILETRGLSLEGWIGRDLDAGVTDLSNIYITGETLER